jgi:hypothetical protein
MNRTLLTEEEKALTSFVQTYELVRPEPDDWPDLHLAYQEARAVLVAHGCRVWKRVTRREPDPTRYAEDRKNGAGWLDPSKYPVRS